MAGKKRSPKRMAMMNRADLKFLIDSIGNQRDRALIAMLYLTGARIDEILGSKKWLIEGIKPKQFVEDVFNGYKIVTVVGIQTLKKKEIIKRSIPILYEQEKDFIKYIIDYVQFKEIGQDELIFPITRQRAWQIIREKTGLFPHFFRHIRLTHLTVNYGFTETELMQFVSWKNTAPAAFYVHLSTKNIIEKMISSTTSSPNALLA